MTDGGVVDFETKIAQVEAAAAAVAKFENSELQVAAFHYLLGDIAGTDGGDLGAIASPLAELSAEQKASPGDGQASKGEAEGSEKPRRTAGKTSSTKKQSFTFDKSLNFYSTSGELGKTLRDFIEAHPASNVVQKSVAVVYWLSKELGQQEIGVDHVYSAFKTLEWPIPSDLLNTLQQAGSKNFLDTKTSTDIKITTHGDNLVEFEMLPKTTSS